jgi:DNA-binding NtrC family response regulator
MGTKKSDNKALVLAVDDSPDTLELLKRHLGSVGHTVMTARSAEEALRMMAETPFDLVITDLKMPAMDGLDLIRHIQMNYHDVAKLMITGYPSIGGAVEAVRLGAEDYLAKPFTKKELLETVEITLSKLRQRKLGKDKIAGHSAGIIGHSEAMQSVFRAIEKAAAVNATVLITGESGTGKELVARAIHYQSARASHPLVPVNCGGIPESLLESELFGHIKGAFSGATETRAGFFQTGEKGTIFLDEIGETSLTMQVKLLRVLQEKEICMVGSAKTQKVDVRILAGTNKNLKGLIDAGRLREDLYYRLNVINIELPPLRDRGDDILLLISHFTAKYAEEMNRSVPKYSDLALELLSRYAWPGNVRELENLVQRSMAMVETDIIDAPDLPRSIRHDYPVERSGLDQTLMEVESDYIRRVMEKHKGNKSKVARILGIDRGTLREKLNRIQAGRGE